MAGWYFMFSMWGLGELHVFLSHHHFIAFSHCITIESSTFFGHISFRCITVNILLLFQKSIFSCAFLIKCDENSNSCGAVLHKTWQCWAAVGFRIVWTASPDGSSRAATREARVKELQQQLRAPPPSLSIHFLLTAAPGGWQPPSDIKHRYHQRCQRCHQPQLLVPRRVSIQPWTQCRLSPAMFTSTCRTVSSAEGQAAKRQTSAKCH